ncbi:MAG: HDOD domain-containing protein [Methylovulum sp.]|nr:HDOD domain-containing protein [Methylovulum sp.]
MTTTEVSKFTEYLGNTLRDISIPPCPVILERINSEMRKDEPCFNQLALVIGSDVGLSAGLISLANSPYFGIRCRVRSVNEALNILGLRITSRAIAGLILRNLFPDTPMLVRFWDASASIARLSGWLSKNLDGIATRAEDAYTFGLFRDCGIAVLMQRLPDYPDTLKKANGETHLSFTAIEEARYPTNHAVVGCLLAQSWWLPEEICIAIRHHHEYPPISQQNSATLNMIAIAQLAEHLFQKQTKLSETCEWGKASAFCMERLGLDNESLIGIYGKIPGL